MSSTASIANIPVISITADYLPEVWEKAVLAVWDNGFEVKTQYDKPEDPPSKDATVMITITDPFNEPRIHKNFPGGPEELESYRQEVVNGIHDHWIDPAAGKWTYTYHERLFSYCPVEDDADGRPGNR
jgi:thymidylate synthase